MNLRPLIRRLKSRSFASFFSSFFCKFVPKKNGKFEFLLKMLHKNIKYKSLIIFPLTFEKYLIGLTVTWSSSWTETQITSDNILQITEKEFKYIGANVKAFAKKFTKIENFEMYSFLD
ncbi:hypothetical protein BpHYR1_038974 [Brachionus plicatilis]|uniref:Uncharacterized protein n=1 Tax=Brachionus plicatilis TaxID=10195 RepID=A0A3M7P4I3_BRAPC|nr:hypothetical protein BpHYR1_038974 [Brachionus plicatilis]